MTTPLSFWGQYNIVSSESIRHQFNQSQIFERVQRGELRQRIWGRDTHLNLRQRQKLRRPSGSLEKRCIRSQMVLYSTLDDEPIALVHQYKRKDGSLGASGRPDPKRLFVSGHVIAVRQSP